MQRNGPTQKTSEKLFLCSETEKCHTCFYYDKSSKMVRRKTHLRNFFYAAKPKNVMSSFIMINAAKWSDAIYI